MAQRVDQVIVAPHPLRGRTCRAPVRPAQQQRHAPPAREKAPTARPLFLQQPVRTSCARGSAAWWPGDDGSGVPHPLRARKCRVRSARMAAPGARCARAGSLGDPGPNGCRRRPALSARGERGGCGRRCRPDPGPCPRRVIGGLARKAARQSGGPTAAAGDRASDLPCPAGIARCPGARAGRDRSDPAPRVGQAPCARGPVGSRQVARRRMREDAGRSAGPSAAPGSAPGSAPASGPVQGAARDAFPGATDGPRADGSAGHARGRDRRRGVLQR